MGRASHMRESRIFMFQKLNQWVTKCVLVVANCEIECRHESVVNATTTIHSRANEHGWLSEAEHEQHILRFGDDCLNMPGAVHTQPDATAVGAHALLRKHDPGP